jgi:outer membrane protein assembly factor BamE
MRFRTYALYPLLGVLALATLASCVSPYHMDVQQGNVVTQEMLDQLRPGMTRSQVRFVLGTPLIADPFHPERWDYFYSYRKGAGKEPEIRRLTVIFKDDLLIRIEGDVVPRPQETAESPRHEQDGSPGSATVEERSGSPTPSAPEQANFDPAARQAL